MYWPGTTAAGGAAGFEAALALRVTRQETDPVASPPVRGRSVATEIVPWQEARLPPPLPDAEGPVDVPHADSAAIPTTPKMGSNRLVRIMKISKTGEQQVCLSTRHRG